MTFLRSLITCGICFLAGTAVCILLERGSVGEEATEQPKAAVTSPAPQVQPPPASDDKGQREKALRADWFENIKEWKEMKPKEPADNSFCLVCHANFETEKLVKVHLREGVGCETCHGMSYKHSEDEDSLIPPDVMFAHSSVALFCVECHDKDELIKVEEEHKVFFEKQASPQKPDESAKQKTCTNCHHMEHELTNRTRRWNKETGKVEWFDGVRMMQQRDEK